MQLYVGIKGIKFEDLERDGIPYFYHAQIVIEPLAEECPLAKKLMHGPSSAYRWNAPLLARTVEEIDRYLGDYKPQELRDVDIPILGVQMIVLPVEEGEIIIEETRTKNYAFELREVLQYAMTNRRNVEVVLR